MTAKPLETILELAWNGGTRFAGRSGGVEIVLDGDAQAGPTPVQALAFALAGCMAIDVVDIVVKGRHRLDALGARLHAVRRGEGPPHYLTRVDLHFELAGAVPEHVVERAIALSRDKYCSVWHCLRPDIELRTTFEIRPSGGA